MASTPNVPAVPIIAAARITAANTSSQGGGTIGTDIFLTESTGANGSFIERVRFSPTATTPTTTTATVARVFYSTQSSGSTTNANTFLLGEVTLPAIGASNASAAAPSIDLVLNISLPTGLHILVTNHAAPAANTAWVAICVGADY
jgi:hypothetical protein